jgi:hypothetical protein
MLGYITEVRGYLRLREIVCQVFALRDSPLADVMIEDNCSTGRAASCEAFILPTCNYKALLIRQLLEAGEAVLMRLCEVRTQQRMKGVDTARDRMVVDVILSIVHEVHEG